MKQNFLRWMVSMCFGLLSVTMVVAGDHYKTVKVKAPFPMQRSRFLFIRSRILKLLILELYRVGK